MRARRTGRVLLATSMVLTLVVAGAAIATQAAGAATAPGVPRSVSALPGNAAATVVWVAPASNGGAEITSYVVTPYLGAVARHALTFNSSKTTALVTGLQNGKSYRFTVNARNASGKGAPSALSGATVVGAPGKPSRPGASTDEQSLDGKGTLRAHVLNPKSNGAVISRYTATCTSPNGGVTRTAVREKPAVPIVFVSGLTIGKTYKCTVAAANSRGTGPRSSPTNAVSA